MRDPRRQLQGRQAKVAGEHFENMIAGACRFYEESHLAKIEKTPEPMRPLRAPNGSGQFLACYTKQAQPDFKGAIYGGRAFVMEAKHTDADRIERSRLTQEQLDELESYHAIGARAFVLVSFSLRQFFRIPWPVWRDMRGRFGRLYVKPEELEEYRVSAPGGIIKFLEGLVPPLRHGSFGEEQVRDE